MRAPSLDDLRHELVRAEQEFACAEMIDETARQRRERTHWAARIEAIRAEIATREEGWSVVWKEPMQMTVARFAIKHFDGINFTPALPLALRGVLELIDAGLSDPVLTLDWDAAAIVAFSNGKPVGVLVWKKLDWRKEAFIQLGYVLPDHRGQGAYRALWHALIDKAVELKLHHIESGTHLDNAAMRAVARALGRTEHGVYLQYVLPVPADGAAS